MTTIAGRPFGVMSKIAQDAIVDKLRACQSEAEILEFEDWFNSNTNSEPLYKLICEFLRSRSISRGLAAKWLFTLIEAREARLEVFEHKKPI